MEGVPFKKPRALPRKGRREDVEEAAVLQDLKNELRKRQMNEPTIREVRAGLTRENPLKEILREFHQVMTPSPIPAMQQDQGLIQALNQAVANNRDMARFAHQMGMTNAALIELMNSQVARPAQQVLPEHLDKSKDLPPGGGGGGDGGWGYGPVRTGTRRYDPRTAEETTSRNIYRPGRSASRPPLPTPRVNPQLKPPPQPPTQPQIRPEPIPIPPPKAIVIPEPIRPTAKPVPIRTDSPVRPSAKPVPTRAESARPVPTQADPPTRPSTRAESARPVPTRAPVRPSTKPVPTRVESARPNPSARLRSCHRARPP